MGLTLTERIKFDELQLLNEGGIAEQLVGQLLRNLPQAVRINADYPNKMQVNDYQLIPIPAYLIEQLPRFL